MGYGIVDTQYLSNIADAIRDKSESSDTYKISEMAEAIENIQTGAAPTLIRGVIRPDAELVKTYSFDEYLHEDLEVTIPAYTTTSTTLVAAASLSPTYTCDFTNYNYYVLIRMATIPEYSISTIAKGREEYALNGAIYEITEVPVNEIKAFVDPTKKVSSISRAVFSAGNFVREVYFSSATDLTSYGSAAYGYNQTVTAPSLSNSTLTLKSPAFIVRGHTTYFVNTFMNAVTDVRYQYIIEVWRAPKGNLNLDGWGLNTQWLKMNEDIQKTGHKLT